MWSNFTIGLIAGLSVAAWVYNKMMRQTGGNTRNSLITAGIAGLFTMAALMTILSFVKFS